MIAWQPSQDILAEAIRMGHARMPNEGCGVVVNGRFVEISNRSTMAGHFAMDKDEYFAATRDGGLEAIVHSHVYQPAMGSQADQTMCETTAVPWLIVSVPTDTHCVIRPHGFVAPLIGRQWCHGSLDCWGVVRDGFRAFTGTAVPDFWRDWNWWGEGGNLIVDNIEAAGFAYLPQGTLPRHCDIVVMQFRSPVPNHLGLYIEPEGLLLHQLSGRTSIRETYGGFLQQITQGIARHRDYLDAFAPPHNPLDRAIWTGEIFGREPN